MNTLTTTLPRIIVTTATVCVILAAAGCSRKENTSGTAAPQQPAAPHAAAPTQPAPTATHPIDPLKAATHAVVSTTAPSQQPATPHASPTSPSATAALTSGLTTLQSDAKASGEATTANLAATATALQKQAEDLLAQYSGELTTLKSGALAVKSYLDKHPEVLPEAAKLKYQQLNTLIPRLESLVGTLKDYKNADLATLVPRLQTDFANARSLYSEVRALLPESL